ncbi:MAG: hypothetical protein ACTSPG_08695 [Candidatus Hodarchaeales archaeon]
MNDQSQLTKEFEQKFGNLNSRIEMLVKTQGETIDNYISQITADISLELKRIIAASYLLCLTEEILEVSFELFQKDFLEFCSVFNSKNSMIDSYCESEFIQLFLNPFLKILSLCSDTLQEMLKGLILELAQGYGKELVRTLIIINYLYPLFNKILLVVDQNIDLRYITAIITTSIEDFIDRKSRLKTGQKLGNFSITDLYLTYKDIYPLSQGSDLIFDLLNSLTLDRIWFKLEKLVQEEIESLREDINSQREDSLAQYHNNIAREKEKYSDDYYVSMITGRLFEVFVLEREFTPTLRTNIVNAVDVMIRRYLIDKHGYASASSEETLDIACNLLWATVWEVPQILAAILTPSEIMELMKSNEPLKLVQKKEPIFKERFCRDLKRLSGKKPLPAVIGNAFISMLDKCQKIRVRISFD